MTISRFLALALAFSFSGASYAANPQVEIKTSLGNMVVELYPDKAPKTVDNFLRYVKDGHYRSTVFHRVIPGFMIQGGGFDKSLSQKPTRPPVKNEAANGLRNDAGTIAMARTSDPHSGPPQAGNRARTGDLNLGKVALYQLSYARSAPSSATLPRGVEPRSPP